MNLASLVTQPRVDTSLGEAVVHDPLPFIAQAGVVLAGTLDYEQTLERLLDLVVPTLADMCSVHLLESDGRFRRIAARCETSPETAALSKALGDDYLDLGQTHGPIHDLLARGESLLSSPATDDDLDTIVGAERRIEIVQQLGVSSAMVVPLIANGRPFGVMVLSRTRFRPIFGPQHLHLTEELARRAALALHSAGLYRAVTESQLAAERAQRRLAILAEASAALAISLDVRTTLQTVVRLAVPLLAEGCSVALVDDDGSLRRVAVAHADPVKQRMIDEQCPVIPLVGNDAHPMAVALATGQPVVDNAISDETRRRYASGEYLELLRRLGVCARIVVPLEARGRRIGALALATSDPAQAFGDDDVALCVELASRAALALDNARLYRDACAARERLEDQIELSSAIVRNIAAGILVVDVDGRISYVNPVAEQLLGWSYDEMIGRGAHDLMHVADEHGTPLPPAACRIKDVRRQERTIWLGEEWFSRADGTTFPVSVSSSPLVRDGRVIGVVTIFRDISEVQRHREELRQSEERLRRALTSAGMVMWERDFATNRTIRSDLASTLYGRPNDELQDDPDSHLRLVHPDDRERIAAVIDTATRNGTGYDVEYRVLWPDGTARWMSGRASVFRDAAGRPRGMSGTTHDITDRKLVELERNQLLTEREAEAGELRALRDRLQRGIEALLGLHEVGQLLTSLSDRDAVARQLLEVAIRAAHLEAATLRHRVGRGRLRLWQRAGDDTAIRAAARGASATLARASTMATGRPNWYQTRRPGFPDAELTVWCVPMIVNDRVIGVLEAVGEARPRDELTCEILGSIALQAATAIENARLYREVADSERALHRLVQQLMAAQEDERRRLAYEIHDGFAQLAAGVQQLLEAYAHDLPDASATARRRMELLVNLAGRTVEEVRRVLAGLRPTVLDDFGLASGLRAYADGLAAEGLRVRFTETLGPARLPSNIEIALFRVAQEALNNVKRHAGIDNAELRLSRTGDGIVLGVQDRGRGFDPASVTRGDLPGSHMGLLSMQERIAQIGGTLTVTSRSGAGTRIRAVVPTGRARKRTRAWRGAT